MDLQPGARLGPYEIVAPLGAGGMGEVYRARDPRLGRDVALKTLPSAFTADVERVARFRREAQVLAALNHPHIAAIHGLEEAGGCQFLVLELVDGESLSSRLSRAALPVDEALDVARQIADALEAAHEKGIVHRDLKPANIAFTADGRVKVLDFGLAKAFDSTHTADQSFSPTITFAATQAGVILGTAAYMSPEQAKGRPIDKRTDIWAFACVVFEMLTGRRAFEGEDVTDTIAAIVRGEPDWTLLPPDVPDQVRLLLKKCLEKDRRARISDISVVRFMLSETLAVPSISTAGTSNRFWLAVAVAAMIALTGIGFWLGTIFRSESMAMPARFALTMPVDQPLAVTMVDRNVAISPDGSHIVYRAGAVGFAGAAQLVVRELGELTAKPLAGHIGREPFFSPDGKWIAYWTGTELRKAAIVGGPATMICRLTGSIRGAHWASDGTILFGGVQRTLLAVPADGGEPRTLTTLDASKGETAHSNPFLMPDGRTILFTISHGGSDENSEIALLDRNNGTRRTLIRGGTAPVYVASGHIVYNAAGTLRAVRFDARRLEVLGEPIAVVDQVTSAPASQASFAVSTNGTLVYVPASAGARTTEQRALVWVDRRGNETPTNAPVRSYASVRLSPDGMRAAVDIHDGTNDIWVWDLARETLTPLNLDPGIDVAPIWTPDGKRIVWASTRAGGVPNLFWQASDGTGAVEQVTTSTSAQFPTSISPDGTRVVFFSPNSSFLGSNPNPLIDIFAAHMDEPKPRAMPLLQSPFRKADAEVSPDGRWIAYHADESGRYEIYVRPFPDVETARWPISSNGGTRPAWSRDGRELFYFDGEGYLTSVAVRAPTEFSAGKAARILNTRYVAGTSSRGFDIRSYDVSPDGKRFLMIKDLPGERGPSSNYTITVVLNWFTELKSRTPGK